MGLFYTLEIWICLLIILVILHQKPVPLIVYFYQQPLLFLLDLKEFRLDLDYQNYVRVNQKFIRPNEPRKLCGDSSKARKILGWEPSLSFSELIHKMCEAV